MRKLLIALVCLILLGLVPPGCDNIVEPTGGEIDEIDREIKALLSVAKSSAHYPAPPGLETVGFNGDEIQIWPYTGTNFSGQPQDPVNLIFCGHADPRDIRTALLTLDGDRTAFGYPPVEPFNSTWEDAIGDMQTTYSSNCGWDGNVVQLACGPYGPLRYHIRFFKMGEWTLANAHFEVQIPGTADHQVLSWEKAEEFIMVDMIRTGLVDPAADIIPTAQINDSPFRTIMAPIYNQLPPEIREYIGGPPGNVDEDLPIGTDGHALVINIQGAYPRQADVFVQDFIINYGQVIPRPFCSLGPMDFVYVEGPVNMSQTVRLSDEGEYSMEFHASGTLTVTPFDPINEVPVGPPLKARVQERHSSRLNTGNGWSSSSIYQKLMPLTEPGSGRFFSWLHVGTLGHDGYLSKIWCGDSQFACESDIEKKAGILGSVESMR